MLMFLVVAMKSRTLSSLPYSATEQMYGSWEGALPDRWPKLASGNIPYCRHRAQVMCGGLPGGGNLLFSCLWLGILSWPGVQTSPEVRSFQEFRKICDFPGSVITAEELAANWSSSGEKNCAVYSLFCIFMIVITIIIVTSSISIRISFVSY